jgi:hypothetical protein
MIKKRGDKYILYTHDGKKIIAEHPTHESAVKQEQAIEAAKHARG